MKISKEMYDKVTFICSKSNKLLIRETLSAYKSQKAVDSYVVDKPRYLLIGHYHTACYLPLYKGVSTLIVGSFQDNTKLTDRLHIPVQLGLGYLKLTIMTIWYYQRLLILLFIK